MDAFTNLGAGWFLYEDDSSRRTVICDALSSEPDHHFGPAAWGKKDGPVSGLEIAEAQAVLRGRWRQVGPDEWNWFSDEGREYEQEPPSWPRVIVVKEGRYGQALHEIDGRVVSKPAGLVELLRAVASNQPARMLPSTSAEARLATAKFVHPHIFGDLDVPSACVGHAPN